MNFRLDVYHHIVGATDDVHHLLKQILKQLEKSMATLDDVVSKVEALGTVEDSVIALLTDIKTKLDQAIATNDPAKLQQLSDALDAQKQRLTDAVSQNTPSES